MIGKKFHRLTVLERVTSNKHQKKRYKCLCDCGREVIVRGGNLRSGHTKSCGCLHKPHGLSTSATYKTWINMIERCTKPKATNFQYYGGRGIRVCARWLVFKNFLQDMGEKPKGATIERIDNDGDYTPGNCEWCLSHSKQLMNRRNSYWVVVAGKKMTMISFAKKIGISVKALYARANQGWSTKEIVTHYSNPKNWYNKPKKRR